jgi:uncharacterized membrane protein
MTEKTPRSQRDEVQRAKSSIFQDALDSRDESRIVADEVTEEVIAEMRTHLERYSGPLPHPQLLAQYQDVDPKATEWIFAAATREQENRHWCDREPLRRSARAQWFAFIISVLVVFVGGLLIYFDKSAEGLATILVPLASVLGIFIYREAIASKGKASEPTE